LIDGAGGSGKTVGKFKLKNSINGQISTKKLTFQEI
jgi:hypothetical protein